jgi:Spy/CpxP family protein refolding chaperone
MEGPLGKVLGGPGGPEAYMRHAGELGLSDAQKDQLKEIFASHRKEMIQKRADVEIAEVELRELMMPDSPQFDKAKKKVSQIAKMHGEIAGRQLDALQKARDVLTVEQIEKLKSLRMGMKCDHGPMDGPGCKTHK